MRCAILSLSLLAMPCVTLTSAKAQTQVGDVLKNYADIAHAGYEDSLITAGTLRSAINSFLASPNARTQSAAKAAWTHRQRSKAETPQGGIRAGMAGLCFQDEWVL